MLTQVTTKNCLFVLTNSLWCVIILILKVFINQFSVLLLWYLCSFALANYVYCAAICASDHSRHSFHKKHLFSATRTTYNPINRVAAAFFPARLTFKLFLFGWYNLNFLAWVAFRFSKYDLFYIVGSFGFLFLDSIFSVYLTYWFLRLTWFEFSCFEFLTI